MVLESNNPASIQDLGRFGVGHLGLAQGGTLDLHAHCWANRLLHNPPTAATLEIINGHMTLKALENIQIALTGAQAAFLIDGKPKKLWQVHHLATGQILQIGHPNSGQLNYLAITGGIQAPLIKNSRSTVIRDQIGHTIKNNELLCSLDSKPKSIIGSETPQKYIPNYNNPITVKVILSYQHTEFTKNDINAFFQSTYQVTTKRNRMGMQLKCKSMNLSKFQFISEGIALDAIQITPNGTPIILLNDHQTLGGYPKIGCIAQTDLPKLTQAKQDQEVTFEISSRQ